MAITIEALSKSNFDLWLEFFDARALKDNPDWDGCYCQNYLNSSVEDAEFGTAGLSEGEFLRKKACDRMQTNSTPGYIAIEDGKVIGWMAAGAGELYKRFPQPEAGAARIVCFTVDPNRRGEGIAASLIEYGINDLKKAGFSSIEARGIIEGRSNAHNYVGPISMYEKNGFTKGEPLDDGYFLMKKVLA